MNSSISSKGNESTTLPRWIQAIARRLRPAFGGLPTFCEDPDGLLDFPEVREALRAVGMGIGDWDGMPTSLLPFKSLADEDMPLLIVESSERRHVAEACLKDYRWEAIHVADLFPKFARPIVQSVPQSLWDRLLILHDETRSTRNARETALLIARVIYGADPDYLRYSGAGSGWLHFLLRLATGDEPLPIPIAHALIEEVPFPPYLSELSFGEALSDGAVARIALQKAIESDATIIDQASPADKLLLAAIQDVAPSDSSVAPATSTSPQLDLLEVWDVAVASYQGVLEFGRTYAEAMVSSGVSLEVREELNKRFVIWLQANYALIQSSPNPALLRLPSLVRTLDQEMGSDKLLLVVVDALGLTAWNRVQSRWVSDGLIGSEGTTRVAVAVLPTITSLSRRAIFEGKPPSQFGPKPHSQSLERKLWETRFGDQSYFTVDEPMGLADAISVGRQRLCLIDVTWDKRGHSIDPRTDSIAEAAHTWAGRTPLREMVVSALSSGYRVILTADHGQVECLGSGRPNVGSLPEERSKRVMIFENETVCGHYATGGRLAYRPFGMPTNDYPLFSAGFESFDLKGAASVSHGGLSIDEVLVPVAEVKAA